MTRSPTCRPVLSGDWWQVAGTPDIGEFNAAGQEPVDFSVWQAADGTWQLWSCIRNTFCPGKSRLLHRWEGTDLHATDWTPTGVAMQADETLGEEPGGLQAPHVVRIDGTYHMFYGDWNRICLATSSDGKHFERVKNTRGEPDLFVGPYDNTRDPMVIQIGSSFHCYYSGHAKGKNPESAIFCRRSEDLNTWTDPIIVSAGGSPKAQTDWFGGGCECPFVVEKDGMFVLFRNQLYGRSGLNTQYASPDPLDFGVDDDRYMIGTLQIAAPEIIKHGGQTYVAALMPGLDGIRISRLDWEVVVDSNVIGERGSPPTQA